MLPVAHESRIGNPSASSAPQDRTIVIPDRFGDPGNPIPPSPPRPARHLARSYRPESAKTRLLMVACAVLTSLGLLSPQGDWIEITGYPWRVHLSTVSMAGWMGPPLPSLTVSLSILLIAVTLAWGYGLRDARWLRGFIAITTLCLMALGMFAGLEIVFNPPGRIHLFWGAALPNPATALAFVLSLVYGARRA